MNGTEGWKQDDYHTVVIEVDGVLRVKVECTAPNESPCKVIEPVDVQECWLDAQAREFGEEIFEDSQLVFKVKLEAWRIDGSGEDSETWLKANHVDG